MDEDNETVIVEVSTEAATEAATTAAIVASEAAMNSADTHALLTEFISECRSRMTALEERLANQPPATTIHVETTVETPELEPEPEPTPEALSIGPPEERLTTEEVAEALASEADTSETVIATDAGAVEIQAEIPPPEIVTVNRTKGRGTLASLLLGKRRA